jgi:hypothetical protein
MDFQKGNEVAQALTVRQSFRNILSILLDDKLCQLLRIVTDQGMEFHHLE